MTRSSQNIDLTESGNSFSDRLSEKAAPCAKESTCFSGKDALGHVDDKASCDGEGKADPGELSTPEVESTITLKRFGALETDPKEWVFPWRLCRTWSVSIGSRYCQV